MTIEMKELLNDIEKCRARMVNLASRASMIDHNVVEASTQLDTLIHKYILMTRKQ
ncbi:aspartyl-phosphate phosphatase Spo0E family protein [Peribacillus deserti]|uniref:aspartyl-phosphate phosphatase Spo0E family protein n=1 Tax=Peribacillus deserti TaxID=673318 RepID=UPI0021529DE3|nr:aspartyl-phosphate phosphatase Spo0E family protein [Peribacillus deserti]